MIKDVCKLGVKSGKNKWFEFKFRDKENGFMLSFM